MAVPKHYDRVKDICRRLHDATCFRSDPALDHPIYAELAGLGEVIVPALLRRLDELEQGDGMSAWQVFSALHEITGVNVIPYEDRGRFEPIRQHWLDWGRKEGIQWED